MSSLLTKGHRDSRSSAIGIVTSERARQIILESRKNILSLGFVVRLAT